MSSGLRTQLLSSNLSSSPSRRAMDKYRYGDANVYYDGTGRVFYQGRGTFPKDQRGGGGGGGAGRPQRRGGGDDYRSYDPQRDRNRLENDPYRGAGRPYTVDNMGYRGEERRGMPPARRYDDDRPPPKEYYRHDDYDDDRSFPEKDDSPYGESTATLLMGIVFMILGVFLLALAIIEILICLDHSYYCRFWAGFLIFEMGLFCIVQRGNYTKKWKNANILMSGFVGTVAVHLAIAFVMSPLSRELFWVAEYKTRVGYRTIWFGWHKEQNYSEPHVSVSDAARPWVCLGVDATTMLGLMLSMLLLTATALVLDRFWKENYSYIGKFGLCTPKLFNPYGQMSAAQALSFVGIVAIYASVGPWKHIWSPVWAAALSCVAGVVNVTALKRPDLMHLSGLALVFQVLTIGACTTAITLSTIGLVDNVKALDKFSTGKTDDFARKRTVASACLLALVDAVALVNNFFGVGLTVRLFDNLYRNSREHGYSDDGASSAYTEESSRAGGPPPGRYPVPNGRYGGGRY